jgi:cytochrome b6-f complex iron-sulfur subunit
MLKTNRRNHLEWWKKCLQVSFFIPLLSACKLMRDSEKKITTREELLRSNYVISEFNGDGVFIGLDENRNPYALSLICTHKQCTVDFKPELDMFICPCHKGKYTKVGKVISGKPKRNLDRYKIKQTEGNIIILDEII